MNDPVLQTTIEVEHKGDKFEFRIPGIIDEIKLGMHERNIRRELDPSENSLGSAEGLDITTNILVRSAAVFEVLLKSATTKWPYSEGKDKEPVVNFRKFPSEKVEDVMEIGLAFEAKLTRFRRAGASDGQPAGGETVAGQPNPG